MTRRRVGGGFSLVEVMVATLLLSAITLAVTQTLIAAQRARSVSERWMQATQLAVEGIERLRAGAVLERTEAGGFERVGTIAPWDGPLHLYRIEVVVSWNDGEPRTLRLATLVRG